MASEKSALEHQQAPPPYQSPPPGMPGQYPPPGSFTDGGMAPAQYPPAGQYPPPGVAGPSGQYGGPPPQYPVAGAAQYPVNDKGQYGPPPMGQAGYPQQPQQNIIYVQQPGAQVVTYAALGPKPQTNMILAIFTTVCCNLLCGILGVYYSYMADQAYNRNDMNDALDKASTSKKLSIAGIVTGIISYVVVIAVYAWYFSWIGSQGWAG